MMDLPSHHRFPRIRNRKPRPPPVAGASSFLKPNHTAAILGGGFSAKRPSRFVRRRSAALPEATSRLFRVGGSMTASGILYPRGRFFFNPWNHWSWADLPLWRGLSLAPRHVIRSRASIVSLDGAR